jgi:hypothetical protein
MPTLDDPFLHQGMAQLADRDTLELLLKAKNLLEKSALIFVFGKFNNLDAIDHQFSLLNNKVSPYLTLFFSGRFDIGNG